MSDPWGPEWRPEWRPEWAPPPAPWGQPPPGWVPPDPWEVAHDTRRRALRYGVVSLVLLPVAVGTFFVGLVTALLGIGLLLMAAAPFVVLLAVALALTSVVQVARAPLPGSSRLPPMLPALATLLAVGLYVAAVVWDGARG